LIQKGQNQEKFIRKIEGTVRVKELLTYGRISGVIGEADLAIF
jgi:hypothetical protein